MHGLKIKSSFFALFFLFGCATSSNYSEYLKSWIGASEKELVSASAFGIPDGSYENDGNKYLIFREDVAGYYCKTTFVLQNGKIADYDFVGNRCKTRSTSRFEK